MRTPETVNAGYPGLSEMGDPDGAFAASPVQLDATYRTPAEHNNPMEPHATTAVFAGGDLTLYDSNQGGHPVRQAIAGVLGLPVERVRVISAHVGGGFGSKGLPRPNVILAAMAARELGRPVRVVFTRRHLFSLVGLPHTDHPAGTARARTSTAACGRSITTPWCRPRGTSSSSNRS